MTSLVYFIATQSEKFIRITDLFFSDPKPGDPKLLKTDEATPVKIEDYDGVTGRLKVEVSRDKKTYATHYEVKRVEHGETYSIDDSKLPAQK